MAARLDLHEEFEQEGMKVAPPRLVFSGSTPRPAVRPADARSAG